MDEQARIAAIRQLAEELVSGLLAAINPGAAVEQALSHRSGTGFSLLSVGKAGATMATAAANALDVDRALVIAPEAHRATVHDSLAKRAASDRLVVLSGDHPLPTERNVDASRNVSLFAEQCGPDDRVVALISGGASAYLTQPAGDLTLDDLRRLTDSVLRSGGTIEQLNSIRKHCEQLKGGRLGAMCRAAEVRVLVVSDVLGDPLDTIGSGPFAADRSTFADALAALGDLRLAEDHARVTEHLERGRRDAELETPKPGDPRLDHINHEVILNNASAVEAAASWARARGYSVETRSGVRGEAAEVGRALGDELRRHASDGRRCCIVLGGETTVTVGNASGVGGRNQELALAASLELEGVPDVGVIAIGTDGIDGPTDAAGAIVSGATAGAIRATGRDPAEALVQHDSNTVLDSVGATLITGPSGTNVNDVTVALSHPV